MMKSPLLFIVYCLIAIGSVKAQDDATKVLEGFFKKAESFGYAGSALVAKGDEALLAKGYGMQDREKKIAQSAETVFSIGSITKQFTGAAILKLEMKGLLSTKDPLSKFFKEVPADKKDITLHQLLTHAAGFPGAIGDDYELIKAADFIKRAWDSPLLFEPGSNYEYSNVGFSILGIIIEQVSGQGYEAFLYENLFKPAGMNRTGYLRPGFTPAQLAVGYQNDKRWGTALDHEWLPDGPAWHLRANGGILSTIGDMHKWFLALQANEVLSADAKEKFFSPHQRECEDCPTYYGYGWVIDKTPDGETMIWHNGGNGVYNAFMGFVPSSGLCVVISSNSNNKISDDYSLKVNEILAGTYRGLNKSMTDMLSGVFYMPSGTEVRVSFDELDRLWMEWDKSDALLLLLGDGTETPEKVKPFEDNSLQIIENGRSGDASLMANALGLPLDQAQEMESEFWANLEKKYGNFGSIEVMGSVLRPMRNACLVYLRVNMKTGSKILTYVWVNNHLRDIRVADKMDKDFVMQSEKEFFAPTNGLKINHESHQISIIDKNGKINILSRK